MPKLKDRGERWCFSLTPAANNALYEILKAHKTVYADLVINNLLIDAAGAYGRYPAFVHTAAVYGAYGVRNEPQT